MNMIRVFMIGYSPNKGGVEAYIRNVTETIDPEKFQFVFRWPEMTIDGKKWVMPPNRHNPFKYISFWNRFFKENHFDVVYFNTCDIVSIDPMIFAKKAGVPVRIIHSHNAGNQMELGRKMSHSHRLMEEWNRKHIMTFATDLLACSDAAGQWMFGEQKYTLIKNGIVLDKYHYQIRNREKCRKLVGVQNEVLIGCIGRLDPQKNPLFTLEIARVLNLHNIKAKLIMIGDGELRAELTEKIKENSLEHKVQLIGAVDNVQEWLSALDCLVMPSHFEGLPFVLVEAQAAGLPCVVSSNVSREADLTGLVHYMDLEAGASAWVDEILNVCGKVRPDTTQQMIQAGYSIEATAQKVEKIIEDRLHQRG